MTDIKDRFENTKTLIARVHAVRGMTPFVYALVQQFGNTRNIPHRIKAGVGERNVVEGCERILQLVAIANARKLSDYERYCYVHAQFSGWEPS